MAKSRRFELRRWLVAMASAAATSAGSSCLVAARTSSSCMRVQMSPLQQAAAGSEILWLGGSQHGQSHTWASAAKPAALSGCIVH